MSWQNITLGDVAEGTKNLFQRGRTWLKDNSPVWLNLEVNPELVKKLWTSIGPVTTYVVRALLPTNDESDKVLPYQQERLLLPPASSLATVSSSKKKPWHKRTEELQMLFTQAWQQQIRSYAGMIEFVRSLTGKGCSRRAIARFVKAKRVEEAL